MQGLLKIVAALLLMVSLTGFCTGGGLDALESVLGHGKIGSSNDYWLEKRSAFEPGRYDRVAVVFGMDDQQACNAMTRALLAAYQETWRCVPAN
jgi:hypothetical protein